MKDHTKQELIDLGFALEDYWSSKLISTMEGALSLLFYSSLSSYFITN